VALLYAIYILMLRQATFSPESSPGPADGTAPRLAVAAPLLEATVGATAGSVVLGLAVGDFQHGLGPSAWAALGWLALLALTSQVIGWLLITVSMPRLAAGMIGALLLIQPAGSVALSYLFLGERPSELQLAGVVLMLAGVVIAVSGRAPAVPYSRRRTRIIRHASAASSGSVPKSP
jgi:drug/metabolite transporter (DMT)-like permease